MEKYCGSIKFLIKIFIATLLVFMVMAKVSRIANNKIDNIENVYHLNIDICVFNIQ